MNRGNLDRNHAFFPVKAGETGVPIPPLLLFTRYRATVACITYWLELMPKPIVG